MIWNTIFSSGSLVLSLVTFLWIFSHNRRTYFWSICKPRTNTDKMECFLWNSKQLGNNIGTQGPFLATTNVPHKHHWYWCISINKKKWFHAEALICNVRYGNIVLNVLKTVQANISGLPLLFFMAYHKMIAWNSLELNVTLCSMQIDWSQCNMWEVLAGGPCAVIYMFNY